MTKATLVATAYCVISKILNHTKQAIIKIVTLSVILDPKATFFLANGVKLILLIGFLIE